MPRDLAVDAARDIVFLGQVSLGTHNRSSTATGSTSPRPGKGG
jgi:hypothetical protein